MARVDSSRASSQACESGVPGVSHSSTGWGSSTLRWYGGGDGGPVGWGKETTTVAEVGCLCIRENVAEGKEATENLRAGCDWAHTRHLCVPAMEFTEFGVSLLTQMLHLSCSHSAKFREVMTSFGHDFMSVNLSLTA